MQMKIKSLTPVDGTFIAVLAEDGKLIKYRGCPEEKIQEIQLGKKARRIVAVTLEGLPCIALTFE